MIPAPGTGPNGVPCPIRPSTRRRRSVPGSSQGTVPYPSPSSDGLPIRQPVQPRTGTTPAASRTIGAKRLANVRPSVPRPPAPIVVRLVLGTLILLVLGLPTIAADAAAVDGLPLRVAAAQASDPTNQAPAPQFQPVGRGDSITSPAQPVSDSGSNGQSGWRIVFVVTVVVVVLVALVQRRQGPEQGRGIGPGRNDRPNNRNVLGH